MKNPYIKIASKTGDCLLSLIQENKRGTREYKTLAKLHNTLSKKSEHYGE